MECDAHRLSIVLGICLAVTQLGCGQPSPPPDGGGEDAGPKTTTKNVHNDGRVCPFNEGGSPSDGLEVGEISVRVFVDECLSSSCDELTSKNCSASLEGETVTVTSSAAIESQSGSGPCTSDCGGIEVDCSLGELEAGDYTLEHGEESFTFTVPSDEAQCVGEAPFGPMN